MFGEGVAWDSGSQRISEAECLTPAGDGGGERQAPQAHRAGCRLGKCYREAEALLAGLSGDVSWTSPGTCPRLRGMGDVRGVAGRRHGHSGLGSSCWE